jgi:hypothetical protein
MCLAPSAISHAKSRQNMAAEFADGATTGGTPAPHVQKEMAGKFK